jgi:hypothetical protein
MADQSDGAVEASGRPLKSSRQIAARMAERWRRIVHASLMKGLRRDLDADASQAPSAGTSAGSLSW